MKLQTMFDDYFKYLKIYGTAEYLHFVVSHSHSILGYFGDVDPASLSLDKVNEYIIDQRDRGVSNSTINKRISLLKRLCRYFRLGPFDFYEIRKLKEKFVTYGDLDVAGMKRLIAAFNELTLYQRLVVCLLLDTGCRRSELVRILVKNVSFRSRSILLESTKTNNNRSVFFTEGTALLLKEFMKMESPRIFLFCRDDGEPLDPEAISSLFVRIKHKAKIKKLSPHMLRHTLTTSLYNKGANLLFIQSILGHSNPNTTKRYVHVSVEKSKVLYDRYTRTTNGLNEKASKNGKNIKK